MRKVIVSQPGNLILSETPLQNGTAWVAVYGNDYTIAFEDAYGNKMCIRDRDMSAFGGEGETLILNANHPLVQYITEHQDGENAEMI